MMNYGFHPVPAELAGTRAEDLYGLALYHFVAGHAELRDKAVVEVSSGRGGGASYLASRLAPRSYVGVERAKSSVALARTFFTQHNLSFEEGSADSIPLASASADVVLNIEASHCYGSMTRFVDEVDRILRVGGHFLFADFRATDRLEQLRKDLCHTRWELVAFADINPNVVMALVLDGERKEKLVACRLPAILRPLARDFAAVTGSRVFNQFKDRDLNYVFYHLRKVAGTTTAR